MFLAFVFLGVFLLVYITPLFICILLDFFFLLFNWSGLLRLCSGC